MRASDSDLDWCALCGLKGGFDFMYVFFCSRHSLISLSHHLACYAFGFFFLENGIFDIGFVGGKQEREGV